MRPTKAALIGLVIGSAAAMVAAAGPLASATLITIGVETQVGTATGLPNAAMLPASLEGLGAVALAYLVTVRPVGAMRWWSVALIGATLAAGMAAQGSHALWFDERTHALELPWRAKLFVSFVPPASGAAALHLVVKMAEGLIAAVRQLQALPPTVVVVEPGGQVGDEHAQAAEAPLMAASLTALDEARTRALPADQLADTSPGPESSQAAERPVDEERADEGPESVRNPQPRVPARAEVRRLLARNGSALSDEEVAVRAAKRTGVSIPRVRRLVREERADTDPARRPRVLTTTAAASATAAE